MTARRGQLLLPLFHCFFERLDAFAEALSQFGKLPGAKDDQNDPQNEQQMHGLKESFKHVFLRLDGQLLKRKGVTPSASRFHLKLFFEGLVGLSR